MSWKRTGKRKRITTILLAVVILLVAVRLALPYVILHYANKSLANMDGYRGRIEDIDLALIRGAYLIDSVYIHKVDSVTEKETPFFAASLVDLSVEWRALLKGSLVGKVRFEEPMLRFTKDKVEPDDVRKDSSTFEKLQEDFMPLKINRLEISNGRIQYIDEFAKPPVDVTMTNASILALNLRNSYDSSALLPATITANAEVYEGHLSLKMKINPLAEVPTFDMNVELTNTNLVKLNDFFHAYAKADVSRGTFGLFSEIAAKDGNFKGYVKPFIKNLKVLGEEDRKDNALKKLWEGLIGTVGEVFENQPRDRVATKVPFEGNIKNPDANVWYAVVQVLQNAFVRALQPSLDQEINIAAVESGKKEERKDLKNYSVKMMKTDKQKESSGKNAKKRKKKSEEKEELTDRTKKGDFKSRMNPTQSPTIKIASAMFTGTSVMTLFSYITAESKNKQFREPEILAKLIRRLAPGTSEGLARVEGWLAHYAVGMLFAIAYHKSLLKTKSKPTILTGLLLGAVTGVFGIAVWKRVLQFHPFPPALDRTNYYSHLLAAHVVFGFFTALGYRIVKR